MLRTFKPTFALPRLTLNPGSILTAAFWTFAIAILARVQPIPGVAPFAMAALAAGLAAGVHPAPLMAGALSGIFGPAGAQLAVPLGAGVILAGFFILQALKRPLRESILPILAGLSILPGIPRAGNPWQSLRWTLCAAAAAASAPFFLAWIRVRPARRHLMPEERAGLILFLGAIAAGLTVLWTPAALTAVFLISLITAPLGCGSAACAGLGGGAAMLLMGLEPVRAAGLGLCGMLAGLAPRRQPWLAPAILGLSSLAAFLALGVPWVDPVCALAAASVSLILPENWCARARQWLSGEAGACDPDRLAMRLRAGSEKKLRALSDAFGAMSESYRVPVDVPDEQRLIAEMRERLCGNCSHYAGCWTGGDNRSVRFLCQLISEAIDWAGGDCAEPLFGDELPPELLRQCHRGKSIPARLGELLEEFARKRRSELKRSQVNQLISAQFMQAQLLLCGMADAQARPLKIRGRQAARARAALDRAGVGTAEVMAIRGDRQMEIVAALRAGCWSRELAARASVELSRTFGRAYAPAEGIGGAEMKFVRLPRMKVSASACCHSRQAGCACGDSHIIKNLEGDRLLLLLSDGMGSGEAAARESAQTVRLLGRFLAADVNRELALETVNELMLARTDSDMFATVDLCVVDLIAGVAEFSKLAACRSVILRKGEVLSVEGGRLPLGILEGVSPSSCRVVLEPGDVIVMASDGVMDAVEEDILEDVLRRHACQPPEMLAETLVSRVEQLMGDARRDDMTALCARVSLRREAA